MQYFIPPQADSEKLSQFFTRKAEAEDCLALFPLDIRTKPELLNRFSSGQFVPFYFKDGVPKIACDRRMDEGQFSLYFIKDMIVKPYSSLTSTEIQMIDRVNPGFECNRRLGTICIDDSQNVTLIRFNLQNALHFTPAVRCGNAPLYLH